MLLGGGKSKDAFEKAKNFCEDPKKQIFLTREAGDKGIDLTAKYLVNMDIPFSWEKYKQRLGRFEGLRGVAHKTLIVYNLVMRGSFEERQVQIVTIKGELSEAIRGKSDIDTLNQ